MGREREVSEIMRELLRSFRVPEAGVAQFVWFGIGVLTVLLLMAAAREPRRKALHMRRLLSRGIPGRDRPS